MDPSQNAYKSVLSEEGEKCIIYKKFVVGKFQNDSCPMTLNDFIVGEEIAQLPCNHIFEKNAILKWLKDENASCPVCRKLLDSKEVKKSKKNFESNRRINSRINPRNMIVELMNRQLEREEEKELQTAIMASLIDQTPSDIESDDIENVD
jgi:SUMO ligase MMS21 Smc5/6 complex component